MRATITHDRAEEIVSLYAQSRDVLRALVSVAGCYRLPDAPDGTWLYAPALDAPGLPLDEAALTIVAECRRFLARHQADQGHEQAGEQARQAEVHAPTVALGAGAEQLAP